MRYKFLVKVRPETWLIYALGGGWGHLNRALSLARVAANKNRIVRIITNSPHANYIEPFIVRENHHISLQVIPTTIAFREACIQVQNTFLKQDYDRAIVDTFPRGLGGELADIMPLLKGIPKVLIHRDLKPEYVSAKKVTEFVRQHYDLVIIPGDGENLAFSHLPNAWQTHPWSIRNDSELDTEKACTYLRVPNASHRKVILVSCSGQNSELNLFGILTAKLSEQLPDTIVRCLAPIRPSNCPPALWVSHFPAIECLPAVDIVAGAGGYNTVSECLALQIPLAGLAHHRMYDRQNRRLQAANMPFHQVTGDLQTDVNQAIAIVRSLIPSSKRHHHPQYTNGAIAAVAYIEQS